MSKIYGDFAEVYQGYINFHLFTIPFLLLYWILFPLISLPQLEKHKEKITALLKENQNDAEHKGSFNYVILHQIRHIEAELAWLNDVIEDQAKIHQKKIRTQLKNSENTGRD